MRIYFDIETEGLYGAINDFAYVKEEDDGSCTTRQWNGDLGTLKSFVKEMVKDQADFFCWHYYQVAMLVEYFGAENYFKAMNESSEITILVPIMDLGDYISTGTLENRNTIGGITRRVLNRSHKGQALRDSEDLKNIIEELERGK